LSELSITLIKNSDLKTSVYLTIQSNSLLLISSFLPISSINPDDRSSTEINEGETIMTTVTGYIIVG